MCVFAQIENVNIHTGRADLLVVGTAHSTGSIPFPEFLLKHRWGSQEPFLYLSRLFSPYQSCFNCSPKAGMKKKKRRRYASNRTAQSNKHQVCIVFAYNVDAQSDRFDQFCLNQGRIVIISHGFFSGSEANAAEWKS